MVLGASWASAVSWDVGADHADLPVAFEVDAGSGFWSVVFRGGGGPGADAVDFARETVEFAFEVLESVPFLGG